MSKLSRNSKIVAEALARVIYNLTEKVCKYTKKICSKIVFDYKSHWTGHNDNSSLNLVYSSYFVHLSLKLPMGLIQYDLLFVILNILKKICLMFWVSPVKSWIVTVYLIKQSAPGDLQIFTEQMVRYTKARRQQAIVSLWCCTSRFRRSSSQRWWTGSQRSLEPRSSWIKTAVWCLRWSITCHDTSRMWKNTM